MKRWIGLALLVFIGTAGWRIGSALSPDALNMAVGVLFGVMAGVPTALLVMAGGRRSQRETERNTLERGEGRAQQQAAYLNGPGQGWGMPYAQQPPIIVMAGPQGMQGGMHGGMNGGMQQGGMQGMGGYQQPAHAGWFPQEAPDRVFNVVGERDALVEEW